MLGTNDPKLSPVASRARGIAFSALFPALGSLGPVFSNPFAGRIRGGWISIDAAASVTIRFWKRYKSPPSVTDTINTLGITCATATGYVEFVVSPDFKTQVVKHGDVFAVEVTALSGVTRLSGALFIAPY